MNKYNLHIDPMLLRPEEVAVKLAVARSRVYAMLKAGELPFVMVGTRMRVPTKQLDQWVLDHTEGGNGEPANPTR